MKLAKSYKIVLIIVAMVMSVLIALCVLPSFTAKADTSGVTLVASNVFTNVKTDDVNFDGTSAKVTFADGAEIGFKNSLVIDNMELEVNFDDTKISLLQLTLTYDSYYVNGNKNKQAKFDKTINNVFELNKGVNTISVDADNNVLVNGAKNSGDSVGDSDYYKIRKVEVASAKLSFLVKLISENTTEVVDFISINQKAGDENYKQDFVYTAPNGVEAATPIVTIDTPIFVKTATGYEKIAYAKDQDTYTVSYNVFSVLGDVKASSLSPVIDENETNMTLTTDKSNNEKDKLYFIEAGTATFGIADDNDNNRKKYAEYTVKVVEKDENEKNAPVYVNDVLALEAFEAALKEQYTVEPEEEGDSTFVPLGSKIEIPSLEDLVIDDRTPYEELTKTLYYVDNDPRASSSSLELTLNHVGNYYFYVTFSDKDGGKMDADKDFIEYDDHNVPTTYGQYADKFVFDFEIKDDAEISVTAAKSQGQGYKGTKYTASKFDIKAGDNSAEFTLWYNKSMTVELNDQNPEYEWVEIKQLSSVEEDFDDGNYTYSDLEKINYNGQYTFTPDKEGSYKITCKVVTESAFREATESTIIRVKGDPKVVKPASTWLQDNVWSVVFLSVGTLCLIGIVVLLFIKPKEDNKSKK